MIVDVQFNPARWTWPEIRDRALAAEAAGHGAVWVFDHLSGHSLRGDRMLECFTLAGALAAATTTIEVGTMVANVANRPPAILASAAASVQEISQGRFRFGLGAGAAPGTRWAAEHDAAGIELATTMAQRHARLEAALDVCDAMWSPGRSERWAGFPLPSPAPPVHIGVNSLALARIAGRRAYGVNARADHPHLADLLAAARAGRVEPTHDGPSHPGNLEVSVWAFDSPAHRDPEGDFRAHLEGIGVARLILVS